MGRAQFRRTLLLGSLLWSACGMLAEARAEPRSISATVTGEDIQKVGFRAMIQKLAIRYNLAGMVRNGPDGSVAVHLQGDEAPVALVLEAMRDGNKKSSSGNTIRQSPSQPEPSLKTFTIYGWTSTSRDITNPYDLVFTLRPSNNEISRDAAKRIWNSIALATLKGGDLAKFQEHLDDDD